MNPKGFRLCAEIVRGFVIQRHRKSVWDQILQRGGAEVSLEEQDRGIKEIYNREYERVYRTALIWLKNIQDAQDAVQNIFIKLLENPRTFESEEQEKAWFITVTKNYCKDILKSSWRRRVDLGEIPERAREEGEIYDVMTDMLKLPVKYREVLYLYYYEGYSVKELSELLDRKQSTLQTQLATARKKLRVELEKGGFVYAGK